VIALSMVSLFTDASSEMIYPLIPAFLATTLGAGARWLGAIEGTADAVAALLKLASGRWSDRLTRRKPLVVAGYTLSSVVRPLVAFAGSAAHVMAIRVGDRVGKGLRNAPRDAMIADAVPAEVRGRAYGFQRAADHAGAVIGPLIAFALLQGAGLGVRTVFLLAAIPAAAAVAVLVFAVREEPRPVRAVPSETPPPSGTPLGKPFTRYLVVVALFTLGNSTDAFLLLRAHELGVSAAAVPLLWALLHVVKATTAGPGGALSDRFGRLPLVLSGWCVYAMVYLGFAWANATWHAWALFAAYGTFYGCTEGAERALVADLVPAAERGRAFGWYNLVLGFAVLPAALIFGAIWDARGARLAFAWGAALAGLAAVALWMLLARVTTENSVVGPNGGDAEVIEGSTIRDR
jgi:MFS family permease